MSRVQAPVRTGRGPSSSVLQRAFLAGIALAVFVLAVVAAHRRPLWYDEIFTLYVAQSPSLAATVSALLAGADTSPPLDYVLRHLSLAVFGSSPGALRWTSAAAFVAGMFAVYAYVRRRVPFLAAASAFVFPVATLAVFYAYEGRAYALLFASAPLALLAWQRAVERPTDPLRLALLTGALCVGPFSHFMGVLCLAPVAAGEAWRSVAGRRVDWGIAGAFAAACLLSLLLIPFARNAAALTGAFWASGYRLADVVGYYRTFLGHAAGSPFVVLTAAVLAAAWSCRRGGRRGRTEIPTHEIVAACVLALTPVSAFVLAEVLTGALTLRYTIALVPGVAILVAYLLAQAQVRIVVLASLAILTGVGTWHLASAAMAYRGSESIPAGIRELLRRSSLPVAFDSPHLYLEYTHYEPRLAVGRFLYPMDAATAAVLRGVNNDEIALRGLSRFVPLNVTSYADFRDRYDEFLVIYSLRFRPALVNALQSDGFCLRPVARVEPTVVLHASRGCD
jgi:uncharacterized membrane protein